MPRSVRRHAASSSSARFLLDRPPRRSFGTPDGETHPNVGLIAFYDATGRYRCSATLVSPTVLLTAAHCTLPLRINRSSFAR